MTVVGNIRVPCNRVREVTGPTTTLFGPDDAGGSLGAIRTAVMTEA